MASKHVERLAKLRRLARGNPSKEEGASAMSKLAELMVKYGVTELDLDAYDQVPPAPPPPPPCGRQAGAPTFVVEIIPGAAFGSVFGFGFGFGVTTGTSTTSGASGFY